MGWAGSGHGGPQLTGCVDRSLMGDVFSAFVQLGAGPEQSLSVSGADVVWPEGIV